MADETRGTLPPGGSSMPAGTQVKKVVKGQQYRPATGPGNAASTPQTQGASFNVAPTLPDTGKGPTSVDKPPPK